MADVTGTLTVQHGGKSYALRLTIRSFAALQAEFGNDLGGVLTGKTAIPDFNICLRTVELALRAGNPGAGDSLGDIPIGTLADDLLTADFTVFERVMAGAFPTQSAGAKPGNAKRAAKG